LLWDGRAATLEEQVGMPLVHVDEMAGSWELALSRLRADGEVSSAFARAYPEGVSRASLEDAVATFERSLVLAGGPFDRWLAGEQGAISVDARRGYELFRSYGCSACHQGANVGGNLLQRFGLLAERIGGDRGRGAITGDPADDHVFRVPSLRLVVHTAPYFHDGAVASLDRAIEIMGRDQLGIDIPSSDRILIAAFLGTLAGAP
jgi:cytochrome c peroxidase